MVRGKYAADYIPLPAAFGAVNLPANRRKSYTIGSSSCEALAMLSNWNHIPMRIVLTGTLLCVSGLCAQSTPVTAPKAATPETKVEDKKPSAKEYLRRSKAITAEIEQDLSHLMANEQTLLKARLGEVWWKTDQPHAKAWIESAILDVEHNALSESSAQSRSRISLAETILAITYSLEKADQKEWSDRLTKAIRSAVANIEKSPDRRDKKNRDLASINTWQIQLQAMAALPADPKKAAQLGETVLVMGGGDLLVELLEKIRESDAATADSLYSKTLNYANQTQDTKTLFALMDFEFTVRAPAEDPSPTPANLRSALLNATVSTVLAQTSEVGTTPEQCHVVEVAGSFINFYNAEQAKAIQEITAECGVRYARKEDTPDPSNLRHDRNESTDDILIQAAAEADPRKRANLKLHASAHARTGDGDFQRSLDILDNFTDEERNAIPGWRNAREIPSLQAMWTAFKANNTPTIQAIIDRTPDHFRASFLLRFVEMLQRNKETDYAQAMFREARQNYSRYGDESELTTAQWLIRDCGSLPDCDRTGVLKEYVAGVNRWKWIDPATHKESATMKYTELDQQLRLSAQDTLADWDFDEVRAALGGIDNDAVRVGFRLKYLWTQMARAANPSAPVK